MCDWVGKDSIYELELYFLAVVGVLDALHGKGGAEDGVLDQRLRFKALIKISRIPTEDSSR